MERVNVVYACIVNDKEQILMVYNCDANHWSLPGGRVEELEFLDEALIREVKEETGYDVETIGVIAVNERKVVQNDQHAIFFTFKCKIISGEQRISYPDEISEIVWKSYEEADTLMPFNKKSIKELINNSVDYINQGRY